MQRLILTLLPYTILCDSDRAAPIYKWGFFNNEHYQHLIPPGTYKSNNSKHRNSLIITDDQNISCKDGLLVSIIDAELIASDALCSMSLKNKLEHVCNRRNSCKVSLADILTEDPCPGIKKKLKLDYGCYAGTSPLPLFDGKAKSYREGVFSDWLTVSGATARCNDILEKLTTKLSDAAAKCRDNDQCKWVKYNSDNGQTVLCRSVFPPMKTTSIGSQQDIIDDRQDDQTVFPPIWTPQNDAEVLAKPEEFKTKDLAVYMNSRLLCESPIMSFGNLPWPDAIKKLDDNKEAKAMSYVITTGNGRKKTEHAMWLCPTRPIMVPEVGWIAVFKP